MFAGLCLSTQAAIYWNYNGTNAWATSSDWAANADGSGSVTMSTGMTDIAYFNTTALNANVGAALAGNVSIGGLVFNNTGTTSISNDYAAAGLGTGGRQMTIGAGGITINSNAGQVIVGNVNPTSNRTHVVLSANQTWLNNSANTFIKYSKLTLGTNTLTLDGTGNITFTPTGASITGAGGLIKNGTGTLTLGEQTNSFQGGVTINNGTLAVGGEFQSAMAAGFTTLGTNSAAASNLVFGGGTLSHTAASVARTDRLFTIGNANGNSATLDSSAGNAANVMIFTNTGSIAFGTSGTHTLSLIGSNLGTNYLASSLGDNGGATALNKSNTGKWIIGGTNSYSGGTTISGGTLALQGSGTLGAATGALTVNGATTLLDLGGTAQTVGAVVVTNSASVSNGTLTGSSYSLAGGTISAALGGSSSTLTKGGTSTLTLSGANSYGGGTSLLGGKTVLTSGATLGSTNNWLLINGGDLDLGGNTITISALSNFVGSTTMSNGTLSSTGRFSLGIGTLNANLAGTGNVYKNGGNPVTLGGSNSFTGGTIINSGSLKANNLQALGNGNVQLNNATALQLLQSLNINGSLSSTTNTTTIDLGTANTLTINQSGNSTFSGSITNSGSVVKSGAGTLTLSGANTYSGTTTVSGGGLAVEGSMQSSLIEMNANTILSGTGSVQAVTMDAGSILSVGNSPGTMTFNGALTLMAGSTNIMQIFVDGFDVLKGNGANTLTMNGVTVFDFTGNTVANDTQIKLFENWSSISTNGATFSVIGLANGQSVDVSNLVSGGMVTVIPEPATIGMLGLGALVTLLIRRMRAY